MNNFKVSTKLIAGFLMVTFFTAIVGFVGITGMQRIDNAADEMYELETVPLPELSKAIEMLQRQRACMREFIIGAAIGDTTLIEDAQNRVQTYRPIMSDSMETYYSTIRDPEAKRLFDEARNLYNNSFTKCMDLIYNSAKNGGDPTALYATMHEYTVDTDKIVENFDKCMSMKIDLAAKSADTTSHTAHGLLRVIIGILLAALFVSILMAVYISGLINKSLTPLTAFLKKADELGDLTIGNEEMAVLGELGQHQDELGQCIKAATTFVTNMNEVSHELEKVAGGDLTTKVVKRSDKDIMGQSLLKMITNLNRMFYEIQSSTDQVSEGAKQIADGAQALAGGAIEQASSIEALSGSISEIAEGTKANALTADKTSKLSETIRESAEKGSHQMDEMISAVSEINEASKNISKIIKTIDDIAFQTNILALNAAVEAARAGQHGKGFAVVAEEVRNLASKSAEAARDTGDMIQNSMDKAELGARIAGETAASLSEIVTGINESSQLVAEIASATELQSLGIERINVGIDQVAQVIQQNSATAEQSAASSQEMSGQADMLHGLITQFTLDKTGN